MAKYRLEWPRTGDPSDLLGVDVRGELPRVGDVVDLSDCDLDEAFGDGERLPSLAPEALAALVVKSVRHEISGAVHPGRDIADCRTVVYAELARKAS